MICQSYHVGYQNGICVQNNGEFACKSLLLTVTVIPTEIFIPQPFSPLTCEKAFLSMSEGSKGCTRTCVLESYAFVGSLNLLSLEAIR